MFFSLYIRKKVFSNGAGRSTYYLKVILIAFLINTCKHLFPAEVPDQQSQNDEIWTAVDEVLDGVDLDLVT